MAEFYEQFATIWNRAEAFALSEPDTQPRTCIYAQAFREWVTMLNREIVTNTPSVVAVNQAKVLLVDKYFALRSNVPKNHRNRIGENGHICIFHVFEQGYGHLRAIELALIPPLLFLPPKPPPPSLPGLFLGDVIDEGN